MADCSDGISRWVAVLVSGGPRQVVCGQIWALRRRGRGQAIVLVCVQCWKRGSRLERLLLEGGEEQNGWVDGGDPVGAMFVTMLYGRWWGGEADGSYSWHTHRDMAQRGSWLLLPAHGTGETQATSVQGEPLATGQIRTNDANNVRTTSSPHMH